MNADRCRKWIEDHPHVVEMFERYALQMLATGRRFGINLLRERVRWECRYRYDGEEYKFPNDVSPHMARALIEKHPSLKGLMVTRPTKEEKRNGRLAQAS